MAIGAVMITAAAPASAGVKFYFGAPGYSGYAPYYPPTYYQPYYAPPVAAHYASPPVRAYYGAPARGYYRPPGGNYAHYNGSPPRAYGPPQGPYDNRR